MASRVTIIGSLAAVLLSFWAVRTVSSQDQIQVGYAVLEVDEQSPPPVATALFSFRNGDGVLLAEAGVAAVEPIRQGRIFVDSRIPTGLALANPSDVDLLVALSLLDAQGNTADETELQLPSRQHTAQFVSQLFGELPPEFIGSLSFRVQGENGLGALTIRQSLNSRGEPLFATLPVADLEALPGAFPAGSEAGQMVLPHLGAGGVLTTQLILINPGQTPIEGEIRLVGSDGLPLDLELDGAPGSSFPYQLAANGVFQGILTSSSGTRAGYAVVTAASGAQLPVGTAIFQFRDASGMLLSEAGVAAVLPTTRARIFVDTAGTQTGVALANPGNEEQTVTLRLLDRGGFPIQETTRALPRDGHFATFAGELFENLSPGFQLMEIESDGPVFPLTLKLTINSRGDPIITTLPTADLTRPQIAARLIFPQVGFGGGFATRFIFIGGSLEQSTAHSGLFQLTQSNGDPLEIPFPDGLTTSQTRYRFPGSGSLQFRPGNLARPSEIILGSSNAALSEFIVNQGNQRSLQPLAIDETGQLRDDFLFEYFNLDDQTAQVSVDGVIEGMERGFSTLAVTVGDRLATTTIAVVEVRTGGGGFEVSGVSEDRSGGLFFTSPVTQTILRSSSLSDPPNIYAGTNQRKGLLNSAKLNSLFNDPRSIAFNQANGTLYVADRANNVIRQIPLASGATVETLAGKAAGGSRDGSFAEARFNNPSGITLDDRAGVWVADTGNHTIRRIDLVKGTVATIAGSPGQPGLADGTGDSARFNQPTGIAIMQEPLAEQLDRNRLGLAPPPTRVIVSDRGNDAIRIVTEDGTTETLVVRPQRGEDPEREPQGRAPGGLVDPVGVASDPFGSVFVTESSGRVLTVLPDGVAVEAVENGTFDSPGDLAITQSGRVIVADGVKSGSELLYGAPDITSITPSLIRIEGGVEVTIRGRNFAPDSAVVVGQHLIAEVRIVDTGEIRFTAPPLDSGLQTVSVQHRGGIDQASLSVRPPSLAELSAGNITTIFGGGFFNGDGGPALEANLNEPFAVALDSQSNLIFADKANIRVRRVSATTGIITTIAGTGEQMHVSPDGGLAILTPLGNVEGVAVDRAGNLFISEYTRILRVDALSGVVLTVAGVSIGGSSGDGGPALEAQFRVRGILVDGDGNLYLADEVAHRVRKVDAGTGIITTIAGNGSAENSGDGGAATDAGIFQPHAVAIDDAGQIYIASRGGLRIVDVETGTISSFDTGDLGGLFGVTVDSRGRVFVCDLGRVAGFDLETGQLLGQAVLEGLPRSLVVNASGELFVAQPAANFITRIDTETWESSRFVGSPTGFNGDGRVATDGVSRGTTNLALDSGQNIFFSDGNNIRRIEAETQILSSVTAAATALGITVDRSDNVYFSDDQGISMLPNGAGPAIPINLPLPSEPNGTGVDDLVVDSQDNLFLVRPKDHRVLRTDLTTGETFPFAGTGEPGFSGDGGPASQALLNDPKGVGLDRDGNIYIADSGNHRVRRVDRLTNVITTVAGVGGGGFEGEGGPAILAQLLCPTDVGFSSAGDMYVMSCGVNQDAYVYRVDSAGVLTRVAGLLPGDGVRESSGDGGPALQASFTTFRGGLALDPQDNLYIADANGRLRVVKAPIP